MEEREFYEKLGAVIQTVRKQSGLNQNELAEKLGVNRSFIAKVESQGEKVSAFRLNQILEVLTGESLLEKKTPLKLTFHAIPPSLRTLPTSAIRPS